jgi:hypothetical protein
VLTRGLMPDWPDEAFTTIWPLPPHLADGQTETSQSAGRTVWRQDDNGNQYMVSRHDSRPEAHSVATAMQARGHKQTYWVAPST